MTRSLGMALLAAVALAGCKGRETDSAASDGVGANAVTTNVTETTMLPPDEAAPPIGATAPVDSPSYLAKAGAGDLFEIESSRAVLAKNSERQRPPIRADDGQCAQ